MHATRHILRATTALVALALLAPYGAVQATEEALVLDEYTIPQDTWCQIRDEWLADIQAKHEPGTWAPMKFEPTDDQLQRLGLPSSEFLKNHRFPEPTLVFPDGTMEVIRLPGVGESDNPEVANTPLATFAGTGCFGIRPGALLLTVTSQSIGWCSLAHAYGTPGAYTISTAGHCGKVGDIGTVIAGTGNRAGATGVVLLDFGKYVKSTGDGGLGNDWALLSIEARYQGLVSPTMCFWGGPLGMYTATGATVGYKLPRRGWVPEVTTNTNPFLVQEIVHYGHGTGVGTGGTPRVATSFSWHPNHFMFFGAISPGDSGSGSNTLGGDGVGAVNEAAGINTHLWVDLSGSAGTGIMGGTRATLVQGVLAKGQIVPYPVPFPLGP